MLASDRERGRVARLLADTLPEFDDRMAVVRASGLEDVQMTGAPRDAWRLLVDEALVQGRFLPLVQAAAARRPEHAGLARLEAGLQAGRVDVPIGPLPFLVAAGAILLAVAMGLFAVLVSEPAPAVQSAPQVTVEVVSSADVPSKPTAPAAAAAAFDPDAEAMPGPAPEAPDDAPAEVVADDPTPAPEPASTEAEPEAKAVPDPTPAPDPTPTPAPAAAPLRAASTAPDPDPAPSSDDGCVGYAWMGTDTTLSAGDVWTVDQATNVRADYPRAENGWSPRSPRVCGLLTGRKVRLGEDPIRVDGGAVWVRIEEGWILPQGGSGR